MSTHLNTTWYIAAWSSWQKDCQWSPSPGNSDITIPDSCTITQCGCYVALHRCLQWTTLCGYWYVDTVWILSCIGTWILCRYYRVLFTGTWILVHGYCVDTIRYTMLLWIVVLAWILVWILGWIQFHWWLSGYQWCRSYVLYCADDHLRLVIGADIRQGWHSSNGS